MRAPSKYHEFRTRFIALCRQGVDPYAAYLRLHREDGLRGPAWSYALSWWRKERQAPALVCHLPPKEEILAQVHLLAATLQDRHDLDDEERFEELIVGAVHHFLTQPTRMN